MNRGRVFPFDIYDYCLRINLDSKKEKSLRRRIYWRLLRFFVDWRISLKISIVPSFLAWSRIVRMLTLVFANIARMSSTSCWIECLVRNRLLASSNSLDLDMPGCWSLMESRVSHGG